MAINKRKVLEAARKHAQKGAQAKALKEFEKLLKLDPRDARLRLEIGDAHRRWGNIDKAIETYTRVADQYTKEGFDARAVAVFKQIHNLDSEAFETYEPLAELYQRMGLAGEAILALQTAADGFRKQGKKREALELLRRMAALDPSNTTSRIKVADLLRQEGMNEAAMAEYIEASGELERQGDREAAGSAYQRILEIEPDHMETIVKLAENLLACGHADRAEPLAKRALEAGPDEPERYELMASVYTSQKRDDELVATYRKLSDLYKQRGDDEQARDILQRFVPSAEFEPDVGIDESIAFGAMGGEIDLGDSGTFDDPESSGTALNDSESIPGAGADEERDLAEETRFDPTALEPHSPSAMDEDLFEDDSGDIDGPSLDVGDEDEIALELDEPLDTPAPTAAEAAPSPPTPVGDPDQLLAEASVYLRYGKRERAIANLEAIIEQVPEHFAALEKLGEAYADEGDGERAVETWLRAVELARGAGNDDGLAVLRDRIGAIDAEAAASLGVAEDVVADEDVIQVVSAPAPDIAIEPEAPDIELDDIEIDLDLDLDDSELEDESVSVDGGEAPATADPGDELEIDAPAAPQSEAPALEEGFEASSSMAEQITDDLEEADFYMKQGLTDEAEVIFQRILAVVPNHPLALLRLGEMAAQRGEDPCATDNAAAPAISEEAPSDLGAEDAALVAAIDDDLGLELDEDLEPAGIEHDLALEPELEPDEPEAELEDDLAAQFLAEVSGSGGIAPEMEPDVEVAAEDDAAPESIASEAAGSGAIPRDAISPDAAPPESVSAHAIDSEDLDPAPDTDPGDTFSAPPDSEVMTEDEIGKAPDLLVPPAAEEADSEDVFDLAAEITDALDSDNNAASMSGLGDSADGFAAVFSQFKQGVSQTLSEGDHEAHFDLGIAYREMGLYDDAKGEFRAAMGNADREIECHHMLGLCAFEQGQYEEAVAQFEQISRAEAANAEQTLSAQYELGRAWEALGDRERARVAYDAVADVDPNFCDVTSLLAALDEPEKPEAETEAGEDFESFEDLISDDSDDEDEAPAAEVEAKPVDYETFDDIMSEVDEDEDSEPGEGVETSKDAPAAEVEASEEPAAEPEPEQEARESVEAPPKKKQAKKKRKKISFV